MSFQKTVGTDPTACAVTTALTLPPGGGTVVYCYMVTNTGTVSLTLHDLVDSELGILLSAFPYTLVPSASAFLTETAPITTTTTNTAEWTAYNPGPTDVITAAASAVVTVPAALPAIDLVKTVGTDPLACATTAAITLPPGGGTVYFCYQATNTGNVTFDTHDLVDSELGVILSSFPYTLAPGASTFVTQAAVITQTTGNTATWTASGAFAGEDSDGDAATVAVQELEAIPALSRPGALVLLLVLCAAGLLALRRLV